MSAEAAPDTPRAEDTPEAQAPLFEAPPLALQERMVEAVLFASAEPVSLAELNARLPHGCDVPAALERLGYRYEGRGVELTRTGEGWAMRTAPDLAHLMQKETVEHRRLSRAATETLAIIAYHQPVTRAEIEEIRGVGLSRGTIDQLLELEWIRFGRRRNTPGRPVTFVVTESFLDHFGLESPRDLPGLKDLRASGLLENRPPLDREAEGDGDEAESQDEMFDDSDLPDPDEAGDETETP